MLFPAKRSRGLDSQDMRVQEDFMEINSTEKNGCIKCNGSSGKLLVCSDRGCPIAVHEKCMDSGARFDDMGNFYCPYCSYKSALAESCRARQKAILAMKVLSTFIDKATSDGNVQKQKTRTTNNNENMQDINAFDNQSVELQEDLQEVAFAPKCSSSMLPCNLADESLGKDLNEISEKICSDKLSEPVVVCGSEETLNLSETIEVSERIQANDGGQIDENPNERDLEDDQDAVLDGAVKEKLEIGEARKEEEAHMKEQADQTRAPSTCEEPALHLHGKINTDVEAGDSVSKDTQPVPKHAKETDKDCVPISSVTSPMRSFAKSASKLKSTLQNEKIITSSMAIKLEKRSNKHSSLPSPNARRKNLPWSEEEEEMLKEGVQKFLTTVNKNLPWRKILDFGRHIFDGTRTPVDLKDKWRKMLAKESSKG